MSLTDILMIAATALSPLIAVQVTRYLDDQKELQGRKLRVFKILMATRAYSLSPGHVEALNSIDFEFSAKKKDEKAVLDVWQQYLDHLGNKTLEGQAWIDKSVDLLVELPHAMGKTLGYEFNKTQIKTGTYSLMAHGRIESEQGRLRQLTLELLEGKRAMPMHVTNLPPPTPPTPTVTAK